jgi:hypothetical protein
MLKVNRLIALIAGLFLILGMGLAACGDTPTATTAATTAAATTAATATTAAPATTAAVATTAATATTAAVATTASTATTAAATTMRAATTTAASSATTAATTTGSLTLPSIAGAEELPLPADIARQLTSQFPQIQNPLVKAYASADDPKTLSDKANTALTGGGYSFGFPGQTSPLLQNGQYIGLYTGKAGSPDVLTVVIDLAGTATGTATLPGVTGAQAQQLQSLLQGKKSMLVAVGAPDLLNALLNIGTSGTGSTTTSAATTTRAATTTVAATTVASSGGSTTSTGSLTLPTLAGVTEVPVPNGFNSAFTAQFPQIRNPLVKIYGSDNDAKATSTALDTALVGSGYKFGFPGLTAPLDQGGQSIGFYNGKAGSPELLTVVVDLSAGASALAGVPGVSAADAQNFATAFQGKKSAVIVIGGDDLLNALLAIGGATGAPVPTPTVK